MLKMKNISTLRKTQVEKKTSRFSTSIQHEVKILLLVSITKLFHMQPAKINHNPLLFRATKTAKRLNTIKLSECSACAGAIGLWRQPWVIVPGGGRRVKQIESIGFFEKKIGSDEFDIVSRKNRLSSSWTSVPLSIKTGKKHDRCMKAPINLFYSIFIICCYSSNKNTSLWKFELSNYHGSWDTAWWQVDRRTAKS